MDESEEKPSKPRFKRLHKETCGVGRMMEYDSYADVREACERKLAEWERAGIVVPYYGFKGNDWLFH